MYFYRKMSLILIYKINKVYLVRKHGAGENLEVRNKVRG